MRLTHIALDRYRNIRSAQLEFHPRFNLIVGENGQGKTNLLSSIYWLSTLTPLRPGRLKNLITWGERETSVRGRSEVSSLYHEIEVKTNGERTFPFREGHPKKNREYFGALSVVSFTPNDLDHRLTEREKIVALAARDMHQYLAEMKRWGCERVQKFREAGWRKAQQC